MSKAYDKGYADGYQDALREVSQAWFTGGSAAAREWIDNNLHKPTED